MASFFKLSFHSHDVSVRFLHSVERTAGLKCGAARSSDSPDRA